MRIGDEHIEKNYIIVDVDGNDVINKSIEAIKVCGITYSDILGYTRKQKETTFILQVPEKKQLF